jgi:hypothetical protein
MVLEIKLKHYNANLKIGFNSPREAAYDVTLGKWLPAKEHLGRLVYGNNRVPYKKIAENITHRNFIAQKYSPW